MSLSKPSKMVFPSVYSSLYSSFNKANNKVDSDGCEYLIQAEWPFLK